MPGAAAATALLLIGLAWLVSLVAFAVISFREREGRAAVVALLAAVVTSTPSFLAMLLPHPAQLAVLGGLILLLLAAVVLWFLPLGRPLPANGVPSVRVDERDIMFARARLRPGTANYEGYYRMRPQHRAGDDRTRALPGLLSPSAEKADAAVFAATAASFAVTEALRHEVDGPVAKEQLELPSQELTRLVKELTCYLGARSVGVAEVRPYHLYTHVGRGSGTWGEPIDLDHRWAVAFTLEMDHQIMATAPEAPVVMESARRYVDGARIAVQLAGTLRALGYPARAHIDGNYRVIAPLVARDAGLGEIGRMGILMTPRLGPRVRLGVVTTQAPLLADSTSHDLAVIDFCSICKKCADCCPTASIPFGDRQPVGDSGLRWHISSETCYRYWCSVGTDCGRCMRVCPFSHPDTLAHNLVRWAIRRSAAARRVLLWLDDLFYGRRPAVRPYGRITTGMVVGSPLSRSTTEA